MTQDDAIKHAFRDLPKPENTASSRRELRALRTRASALSPLRILANLALAPVVAAALTVSIYVRTSEYDPPDALRHLIALTGCSAAAKLKMTDMARGEVGYHARNDLDGDGISCETDRSAALSQSNADPNGLASAQRYSGGAKFLRP